MDDQKLIEIKRTATDLEIEEFRAAQERRDDKVLAALLLASLVIWFLAGLAIGSAAAS
jgi:hypothetical protein